MSHLGALLAGWVMYTVLANGISPTSIEPMSESGLRIVGAALLGFVGCIAIFHVLHIHHTMAYVTAFTAAIGAFPSVQSLAVVVLAILFVAGLQAIRRKLWPEPVTLSEASFGDFSDVSKHDE